MGHSLAVAPDHQRCRLFGLRRRQAPGQAKVPRLPEKNLLLLALVGGGVGAWLGMELFRHKTQHRAFRICVPLFTLIWIVVVGGLYLYFNVIR